MANDDVEKFRRMVEQLKKKYGSEPRMTIYEGNVKIEKGETWPEKKKTS